MTGDANISLRRLILCIAAFAAIGIPVVAYLWDTLNLLFAGYFDATRMLLALPALLLFLGIAWLVARQVQRWDAAPTDRAVPPPAQSDGSR